MNKTETTNSIFEGELCRLIARGMDVLLRRSVLYFGRMIVLQELQETTGSLEKMK